MSLELYREVALSRDLPEHHLKAGDIALLLEFAPHPAGGEDGCVLEVFNAVGESLKTIAVPSSALVHLRADEVLAVQSLVDVG